MQEGERSIGGFGGGNQLFLRVMQYIPSLESKSGLELTEIIENVWKSLYSC